MRRARFLLITRTVNVVVVWGNRRRLRTESPIHFQSQSQSTKYRQRRETCSTFFYSYLALRNSKRRETTPSFVGFVVQDLHMISIFFIHFFVTQEQVEPNKYLHTKLKNNSHLLLLHFFVYVMQVNDVEMKAKASRILWENYSIVTFDNWIIHLNISKMITRAIKIIVEQSERSSWCTLRNFRGNAIIEIFSFSLLLIKYVSEKKLNFSSSFRFACLG